MTDTLPLVPVMLFADILAKTSIAVSDDGAPSSLVVVCTFHRSIDCQFAGLHDFAADDHLVEDLIHLVEVEDEVELAHAPKVLV